MSDLSSRRARIQGMEAAGIFQKVKAQVPQSEMYHYSTALRSITHGRGVHHARFSHYDVMPDQQQEKVIEEAKELEEA